jgi:hypothetical protein
MATKYATTEYNRQQRVTNRLRDIYARAIAYRFTADKIHDELAALYASADYKRLTRYSMGYVAGLAAGYSADIWQNHVIWMLGPSAGPTRIVHSEWTDEMSTLCRLPGQLYGGHFWTDDNGQPTDKPYTEYKPTN